METFAQRLKYYLEQAELKQADLVKLTGINKGAISEYLAGSYEPKQKNIYKLATALNIKPSQLMGVATSDERAIVFSPHEKELVVKYRTLSDENRIDIDKQIDYKLYLQGQAE